MSDRSMATAGSETRRPDGRQARTFALLGLLSGCIVWALLHLHDLVAADPTHEIDLDFPLIGPGYKLRFDDFSLLPGLVFGIVVGLALYRRRLASATQVAVYAVAAIVANFVATDLAYGLVVDADSKLDSIWIGMIVGFAGAACLTLFSLAILPFTRRWRPCLLMIAAGTLLGGLLQLGLSDDIGTFGFLILYGLWQAGFAAAFGTAVPGRTIEVPRALEATA